MLFRRDGSLRCALLAAKNIPTAVDTATPSTRRQSKAGPLAGFFPGGNKAQRSEPFRRGRMPPRARG
jgi:hypothetical protein